ncbi:hypothetical protein AB5I41_01285 [Sphingomonas sp. MMS24-JH45]
MLATSKLGASSDGRVVQVGAPLFARFDDDQIAVVVAHELSHAILRHRARLEAVGVKWGLLAQFGRKRPPLPDHRERGGRGLGAFLLRNAGWDPQNAVRFWREEGAKIDGGMFHSRTHPSASNARRRSRRRWRRCPRERRCPMRRRSWRSGTRRCDRVIGTDVAGGARTSTSFGTNGVELAWPAGRRIAASAVRVERSRDTVTGAACRARV